VMNFYGRHPPALDGRWLGHRGDELGAKMDSGENTRGSGAFYRVTEQTVGGLRWFLGGQREVAGTGFHEAEVMGR
jgi:hypothetical protein